MSSDSPIKVKPKRLTSAAFASFGDVIQVCDSNENYTINEGHTQRHNNLAKLELDKNNGKPLINIFCSTPVAQPIVIREMERHPLSSQLFMPLGNEPYLVVVSPKGEFDESLIEVFIASCDQGVNYHAGTWHHYSLALNNPSNFIVVDRGGEGDNCDLAKLKYPMQIDLSEITK